MLDDPVGQAIGDRLRPGEVAIPLHVGVYPLELLTGVLGVDLVDACPQRQHLAGVDLDVARRTLEPTRGLVDEDPAVGQREALAGRSSRQQQRAHRHRDPVADRLHVGADELHRVVDRHAGVDRAARGVDVEVDVLVRIVRLQVDELRDDQVCRLLVDLPAKEDDAVVEQAGVDVERALAARGLFDDHRNEWHGASCRSGKVQPVGCRHRSRPATSGLRIVRGPDEEAPDDRSNRA